MRGGLREFSFVLDGARRTVLASLEKRLIDILRDDFGSVSAKKSCGIGRCGSCMVLKDGKPFNSCLLMMWQVEGAEIVTPAGLETVPEARTVRSALAEENAFQCGYCAPGFTVALTALLRERPSFDEADVREALSGNICRCTGYHSIIRGALRAADMSGLAEGRPAANARTTYRERSAAPAGRTASAGDHDGPLVSHDFAPAGRSVNHFDGG